MLFALSFKSGGYWACSKPVICSIQVHLEKEVARQRIGQGVALPLAPLCKSVDDIGASNDCTTNNCNTLPASPFIKKHGHCLKRLRGIHSVA